VSEVSPGHLKFKFQRLLKKVFYWPPTDQLYGPPSIGYSSGKTEKRLKILALLLRMPCILTKGMQIYRFPNDSINCGVS
jgi:hypothetical protein